MKQVEVSEQKYHAHLQELIFAWLTIYNFYHFAVILN